PAVRVRDVGVLDQGPLAVHDLVQPVVILQRIVAGEVIILGVLSTPDQAAPLIDLSSHGLHADRKIDVLGVRVGGQRDVENGVRILGRLGKRLALIGIHHGPGSNLAHKSFGDLAVRLLIELPGSIRLVPGKQGSRQESQHHQTRSRADLRHHRYVSVAEQKNLGIESRNNLPDVLGELSNPGLLRWRKRGEMAEHAGNRPFTLEQIDEIVSREPTRLKTAAKRLQGTRIEPQFGEDARGPVQDLRGSLGNGLDLEAVAGYGTEVVDTRLVTGPTPQTVVQKQLQPEEE